MPSVARYLFTRLYQNGVRHVHGVPGDYTLKALDHLGPSGLQWVGSCNELNAGYAADGYARIRGLSAVFTTYGVGELSAINAIAGSYAEHVPVVHVVGTPARRLQNSRALFHHVIERGRNRIFAEMSEKVTVAQANLVDAEEAPGMIDRTIEQCLIESRPVYIELPADMVAAEVSAARLEEPLKTTRIVDEGIEDMYVTALLRKMYASKQPLLLVDRGGGVSHIYDEINQLVQVSGIPTLTMPSGAGMVDSPVDNYYGVHSGPVGKIDTMPFLQASDLVLAFGPMFSDTQTLAWATVPDPSITVTICKNSIEISALSHPINAKSFMCKLLNKLDSSKLNSGDVTSLGNFRHLIKLPPSPPSDPIDQDTLWLRLNAYLRPNDIVLLANGTPVIGGRDFILPPNAKVIASGLWFSIGHMLPAAQGAALAQQESRNVKARTILFEGDGSFQSTAQELSTVIRQRLNVTIFIINNSGYAYERHIHGMHAEYNDIAQWRYLEAASFFGAPANDEGYAIQNWRIRTWAELDALLTDTSFCEGPGLKMVDVVVGKWDVPEKFREVFRRAGQNL